MCGIVGYLQPKQHQISLPLLRQMSEAIKHRGPDASGIWTDSKFGIALAQRRLAILDLSAAGQQPMLSACGNYTIVFNGEIYNHLELRTKLAKQTLAPSWRGHSDTESLLAGFAAWGIEDTLKHCVGMFALALWDRNQQTLTLARDRMGEKPLYYGWQNGCFLFGSELKALKVHPAFLNQIDRNVLTLYVRYNYIPAPYSIYQGIFKLPPSSYLVLAATSPVGVLPKPINYWQLPNPNDNSINSTQYKDLDDATAISELDTRLRQTIADQMIADVPLGAFLSGGIDSTTVVALMQAQSSQPIKTFTIGFQEASYNEAQYAHKIATYLGCDHTELYVTPQQAMAVIPSLPSRYDEPYADSSQIPTVLIAQLTRQHVTVSLSGDGGDELFGGYNRYFWASGIWQRLKGLPYRLRIVLANTILSLPPGAWNRVFNSSKFILPSRWHYSNPGDKLHKLAAMLQARSKEAVYLYLVSQWQQPSTIVLNAQEIPIILPKLQHGISTEDFAAWMMYQDQITYLPDDILVKVDRAAMSVALETRVPMLDHRLVEFAWQLPMHLKIRNGQSKWLLRQVLYQYVPKELLERPKIGFGIPIDTWLRGPLRDWAESLLTPTRLKQEGYFNSQLIQQKWQEHLVGSRNWAYHIWTILMFQAWLDQ
ncbi:asparagine synthase [Achromatium sp. WMS3]|nr:asparagine synthase [Achromatium sp. WMS3]